MLQKCQVRRGEEEGKGMSQRPIVAPCGTGGCLDGKGKGEGCFSANPNRKPKPDVHGTSKTTRIIRNAV